MGVINLYDNLTNTHKVINANGKLKNILPEYDFSGLLSLKEGSRINANYIVKKDDVVYVRSVPKGATTAAIVALSVVVVAAGVGVGVYLYNRNQKYIQKIEKSSSAVSDSSDKLPFLRGATNQTALGKTIPYFMGEMYFTPYKLNNGYYSIGGTDGETQYWNSILSVGYNDILLKSLSIGSQKLIDFDTDVTTQNGVYNITGTYLGTVEIADGGELTQFNLNQKVIGEYYDTELKHEHDEDAEPLIEQCADNAQKVEVCIEFPNGLRKFDSENGVWVAHSVGVKCEWSNNADTTAPTWVEIPFENSQEDVISWVDFSFTEFSSYLDKGYVSYSVAKYHKDKDGNIYTGDGFSDDVSVRLYKLEVQNVNSDLDISIKETYLNRLAWNKYTETEKRTAIYNALVTKKKKVVSSHADTFNRLSKKALRFVASKTFTASETYGKSISIRLTRTTPQLDSQTANETVVLKYINTFCYDYKKSTSSNLVLCQPVEEQIRDKTLRLGVRFEATDTSINNLDELNVIGCGLARTWNSSSKVWSNEKGITSNPASWILEILTSSTHRMSQFSDSDIDLQSLGELYYYCSTNELYTDGVITDSAPKKDIIQNILESVGADLILNEDGKYAVVIDQKETTPVALINSQNVSSITYAKDFSRKTDGVKVTFTDREQWESSSEYVMKDGESYDSENDTITELAPEYVTHFKHAWKMAQRQIRQTALQPRTITVNVGMEGDYYPLYSTVMLQLEQFAQGLCSSYVKGVTTSSGYITKVTLADTVEMVTGNNYGLIIQAQNDTSKNFVYCKIKNENKKTNVLTLSSKVKPATMPEFGNICSFGLLDSSGNFESVTNVMKITGIERADNHGVQLTLKDYNEEIYNFGTIPEYKSNITRRPINKQASNVVTVADLQETKLKAVQEAVSESSKKNIRTLSSLTESGNAGEVALYNGWFYKYVNNKWQPVAREDYLGALDYFPDVTDSTTAQFFLYTGTAKRLNYYLSTSKGNVTTSKGKIVVSVSAETNFIYSFNNEQWRKVLDRNDYRYLIATNDLLAHKGAISPNLDKNVQDRADKAETNAKNYAVAVTPKFVGTIIANADIPAEPDVNNYFLWNGDDVTTYTKGTLYKWTGDEWLALSANDTSSYTYYMSALQGLSDTGATSQVGAFMSLFCETLVAQNALIDNLKVKIVELQDNGYIKSANYDMGEEGFKIDHEGNIQSANYNEEELSGYKIAKDGKIIANNMVANKSTIEKGSLFKGDIETDYFTLSEKEGYGDTEIYKGGYGYISELSDDCIGQVMMIYNPEWIYNFHKIEFALNGDSPVLRIYRDDGKVTSFDTSINDKGAYQVSESIDILTIRRRKKELTCFKLINLPSIENSDENRIFADESGYLRIYKKTNPTNAIIGNHQNIATVYGNYNIIIGDRECHISGGVGNILLNSSGEKLYPRWSKQMSFSDRLYYVEISHYCMNKTAYAYINNLLEGGLKYTEVSTVYFGAIGHQGSVEIVKGKRTETEIVLQNDNETFQTVITKGSSAVLGTDIWFMFSPLLSSNDIWNTDRY